MRTNYPLIRGYRIIMVICLLIMGAGAAMAALPDELELEIITAPGFISSPCPLGNSGRPGNTGNLGMNTDSHAAHHPQVNTSKPALATALPVDEKARLEIIQQLAAAEVYLSGLIQKIESGAK